MIPFIEFVQRSTNGPVMTEQQFDLKLSRVLRKLAADFNIHFNHDDVICTDANADAVYQAAVEFLAQVGVYNVETNRVILLSPEETRATKAPNKFTRGAGKEAVIIPARKHDSRTVPHIFYAPIYNMWYRGRSQFLIAMIGTYLDDKSRLGDLARELKPQIESIDNKAGTVGEIVWNEAIARWKAVTAEVIGTPGIYLDHGDAVEIPAILGCFRKGLYQNYQSSVPVHIMPEMKLNWHRFILAYLGQQMDIPRWVSSSVVLGGYARNAEETAIIIVANSLAQLNYARGDQALLETVDLKAQRTSRAGLQAVSGAFRAVERNIGVAAGGNHSSKNGLGTAASLYEQAAAFITQTCSGGAWMRSYAIHPGKNNEPKTDLDGQLVGKVARAAAGMEREKANPIVNQLLGFYEGQWDHPEEGKPFSFYYDLKTFTPSQELVDLNRRVEEKLISLGLPLS